MRYIKYFIAVLALALNMPISYSWQNRPGNQQCNSLKIFYPESKQELISIIKNAAKENRKMCVVGASYSYSDIACNNDYVISLKNLNNILSVDKELMQVCVQGGIILKDFNRHIAKHGLAFSNLPAVDQLSLAGALSTATHGTGHTGTLSSFIVQIELIDSEGELHELSLDKNPELFKAATVSLGTLGIIYSVTMQCEPLFYLEYHETKISLDQFLSCYSQLHKESDHIQFRWQLENDMVHIDQWQRIPLSQISESSSQQKKSYEALPWFTSSDFGLASEIAIPVDLLPQAISAIKSIVHKYTEKGFDIPELVCRFVKADKNSYLSPAADYDVVYLNIGTDLDTQYYEFFQEFERAMYALKGRPHWGKINFSSAEKVHELYGENFIKFLDAKKSLDPLNRCSNFLCDRIMNSYK